MVSFNLKKVQDFTDASAWTDITAAVASASIGGSHISHVLAMTAKKYIRLVVVNSSGSTQTSFEVLRQVVM